MRSLEALASIVEDIRAEAGDLDVNHTYAVELLGNAMTQWCLETEDGWLDTAATTTFNEIGDYLVTHRGWEHREGFGRRQFYRSKVTP